MGNLICLSAVDGEVVWEKKIAEFYSTKPPLWGYASHPLVDGENLIVPTGGKGSGLVAFNKMTGEEVWKSISTFDIGYAPLAVYEPEGKDRQLIFWHGAGVTSVDPATGSEFWNVKFPEEKNSSVVTIATPRIIDNQLLIAEYYKGALLLELGPESSDVNEIWRSTKIDPRNDHSMSCMMSTPVIKDGLAYGVANDSRGNGVFRCTKIESGEEVWTEEKWLDEKKAVMFANGFIVENEDKYFVFNDVGELMICKLSPEGYQELDRAKLLEPTSVARGRKVVWSHPAFAGQQMFARNDEEIICVDLKK
jgi:outer membrane protein assembly factor BamB